MLWTGQQERDREREASSELATAASRTMDKRDMGIVDHGRRKA
jgi:hypothetical protein